MPTVVSFFGVFALIFAAAVAGAVKIPPWQAHADFLDSAANGTNTTDSGNNTISFGFWTGYIFNGKTAISLFGFSAEHIASQIKHRDRDYDTSAVASELHVLPPDNGRSQDLPDPGVPETVWHGASENRWDYAKDSEVTYQYACGTVATGKEQRLRSGSHKLRNKGTETAMTPAHTCRRHWCMDTTAIYVCNDMDTDLVIPYYNIGWMADRIDRLCCDDNQGKSGRMWHYRLDYSVVLGYGSCRADTDMASPYPYGEGSNGRCVEHASSSSG